LRAPFQVLVLPFRHREGRLEFAIFRRADDGSWQGIAGGGEDAESPVEAARREAEEEAGIPTPAPLYRLRATGRIPAAGFGEENRRHWPRELVELPEHAFAVDCTGLDLPLSAEHTAFEWVDIEEANRRLRWASNRAALAELHQRLSRGVMPPPE
jgi:dATP pyrophosphohydrolase